MLIMAMTHYQLKRLIDEISPRILGGMVQKIRQPDQLSLEIALYSSGEKNHLTFRIAHGLASCYLSPESTGPRGEAAGDFCIKLRSMLDGTVLEKIEQAENDRIVRFVFSGSGRTPRTLLAEIFSAAGNLFLLDEENKVLAVANTVAARGRQNFTGSTYSAPQQPSVKPPAMREDDPLEKLMLEKGLADYNSAVRAYYEDLVSNRALIEARQRLGKILAGERKRITRLRDNYKKNVSEAEKAGWYRECGEILTANYRSLRKGQEFIHLPDLYAENPLINREIPLDPARSPQENVERYFKKYRKLKGGAEFACARLAELKAKLSALEKLELKFASAETIEELKSLAGEAGISLEIREGSEGASVSGTRLPYRRFKASDGTVIMVGRSGEDNDRLTFHIAKGKDLWLHVSGAPGSHVVLVTAGGGKYTEEALLDAAHLAVHFSSLKKEPLSDVDYTYRQNVNRARGLPPGKVFLAARKTIHLRVDTARLKRLLSREKVDLSPT